ncbi:MAG: hypothetical protein RIS64_4312 [Bacteroidota bacterium]|jgi:hypothetical protein
MNNVVFLPVNYKQNTYIKKNIQKSIYVATLANYCVFFTEKTCNFTTIATTQVLGFFISMVLIGRNITKSCTRFTVFIGRREIIF